MQIYTGITSDKVKLEEMKTLRLGIMISAHPKVSFPTTIGEYPVALDNGAFPAWQNGFAWNLFAFLHAWSKCNERKLNLDFVVAPDRVAKGVESLTFSGKWADLIPFDKWAIAVQDGMEPYHLGRYHFQNFSHIFVGGTVDWKWQTAETWVSLAHREGLKCHIGRCSTVEQLRRAHEIGADSCDSTCFVRNDRFDIPREFVEQNQQRLF